MARETVTIRGVELGAGRPKICVPIVAPTAAEICAEGRRIAALRGHGADLCEWRLDWYQDVWDGAALADTGRQLAAALAGMPLLVTFRTAAEGGVCPCAPEDYAGLVRRVCQLGVADLVDIELATDGAAALVETARACGVKTVLSSHDFAATPPRDEMLRRLRQMEALGADLCKLAVMPTGPRDVLALMEATMTCAETARRPLITMSMGALGAVSRLSGALTGSCVTFAALSQASAPGQIPAGLLSELLPCLQAETNG